MKIFYAILAILLIGISLAVYFVLNRVTKDAPAWIEIYYTQARVPMFTGFLTLGSFLLTLQTAILQRLKDAYDCDDHARKVQQMRKKGHPVRYYGSLERVGLALSTNVILALTTSTLQMTLGFFRTNWSTALCVSFAITTIFLVVYLTIQLVLAHHQWFNKIEEEKNGPEANHEP